MLGCGSALDSERCCLGGSVSDSGCSHLNSCRADMRLGCVSLRLTWNTVAPDDLHLTQDAVT